MARKTVVVVTSVVVAAALVTMVGWSAYGHYHRYPAAFCQVSTENYDNTDWDVSTGIWKPLGTYAYDAVTLVCPIMTGWKAVGYDMDDIYEIGLHVYDNSSSDKVNAQLIYTNPNGTWSQCSWRDTGAAATPGHTAIILNNSYLCNISGKSNYYPSLRVHVEKYTWLKGYAVAFPEPL